MRGLASLLIPALTALLVLMPAPARAARYDVRVGIGDQRAAMFGHDAFARLKLRQVRHFIAWNAIHDRSQRLRARRYVKAARAAGTRVLLHFSTDDFTPKRAALPSVAHYRKDVGRLVRYFRKLGVRDFGTWNEANHKTQATWDNPRRAARYFKTLRRIVFRRCSRRSCRVVGLDVLDQRGVERYIARFLHHVGRSYARRYLRIVGIHNYSDVNRRRSRGLRSIIRAVHRVTRRPNFWLTETGGVVKFGRSFPCSERRAASRLNYLFDTVRRHRRSLQRVYVYNWTGAGCDARFDAGLTRRDGTLRPGYHELRRALRRFKR